MIYKLLISNMFPYIQPFSHKTITKWRLTVSFYEYVRGKQININSGSKAEDA